MTSCQIEKSTGYCSNSSHSKTALLKERKIHTVKSDTILLDYTCSLFLEYENETLTMSVLCKGISKEEFQIHLHFLL